MSLQQINNKYAYKVDINMMNQSIINKISPQRNANNMMGKNQAKIRQEVDKKVFVHKRTKLLGKIIIVVILY